MKKIGKISGIFVWLLVVNVFFTEYVFAIPPPDLILSSIQSFMQFIGIAFAFIFSGFFIMRDYIRVFYIGHKKLFWGILVLFFSGIFIGGYLYFFQQEKDLYRAELHSELQELKKEILDMDERNNVVVAVGNERDQVDVKQISKPQVNESFVVNVYNDIRKELVESKKQVQEYKSDLALYEKSIEGYKMDIKRYQDEIKKLKSKNEELLGEISILNLNLRIADEIPVKLEKIPKKLLDKKFENKELPEAEKSSNKVKKISKSADIPISESLEEKNVFKNIWSKFYDLNRGGTKSENEKYKIESLGITIQDFIDGEFVHVIDLREKRAVEQGYVPHSKNIRLTDFLKGDWQKSHLGQGDKILFLCYTGSRGSLAAEFLSEMGYKDAHYLIGGITEGVKNNDFPFRGDASLNSPKNIDKLLSTEEVRKMVLTGSVGIDVRVNEKFSKKSIPRSINIFRDGLKISEIDMALNNLDKNKSYFGICDSWLNCYSAKILGFELEIRGITFVGRYAKPYEY